MITCFSNQNKVLETCWFNWTISDSDIKIKALDIIRYFELPSIKNTHPNSYLLLALWF